MAKIKNWMLEMEESLDDYLYENPENSTLNAALTYVKAQVSPVDKAYISKLYKNKMLNKE